MGYYDSLETQIERFERINTDEEYYEEKDYSNYYNKKDVLDAIRKYGDELEGEKNQVIIRFIKAIGNYIEDEEILTELFMRNGKRTLDVISNETDLLTREETKILIYRCCYKCK